MEQNTSNYFFAVAASVTAITVGGLVLYYTTISSSKESVKKESKKKAVKEEKSYPCGPVSIYFGSQTGTAEGFARTMMVEGKKHGFEAKMVDLEDFDAEKLAEETFSIFLMATYGEGEPTDNAVQFYKWIKNEDDTNPTLTNKYAVFGLGNKQYEHYNRMGKLTDKFMEKMGSTRVFEYGEGDDDEALEEDFDRWRALLWPALVAQFNPEASEEEKSGMEEETFSKVDLTFSAKTVSSSSKGKAADMKMNSSTKYFFSSPRATVLVNKELRTQRQDSGSTRHIEIDLKSVGLQYCTADNLAVIPENCPDQVELFSSALGYNLDEFIALEGANGSVDFKHPFPSPCSIRELLTAYVDIHGLVRHSVLAQLVAYVEDSNQKAWLMELLDKGNRKMYHSMIEERGKSLLDLFTDELSSCQVPLSDLLHIAPLIQPRYYTISSSSSVHPSTVHITVSITEYPIANKKFVGLTSGFVKRMVPGSTCCTTRVFVRASSFRLPQSISTPIVMIGPGTGLAPMRALLQEREYQSATGANILYFGCKNKAIDYIYRDELEQFYTSGVLTEFHTAFSRDGKAKEYVQHLMVKDANAKELYDAVEAGAYVYVCGATAMGHDVMAAFLKVMQEKKGVSSDEALKFVKRMQDDGKYVQELWTA